MHKLQIIHELTRGSNCKKSSNTHTNIHDNSVYFGKSQVDSKGCAQLGDQYLERMLQERQIKEFC